MKISCPGCGTVVKAEEEHVGLEGCCLICGTKFLIPPREGDEAELATQKKEEAVEAAITKALALVVPGERFAPDFFDQVDRETLLAAAEGGDSRAQCVWGRLHSSFYGLLNDEKEAVKWYRKSAEQGYAMAQNNLAYLYAHGRGVEKNGVEALKWYRKAAEQNHTASQSFLADIYAYGRGVEKDEVEAVKWYRKAAEQGHQGAKAALRELGVRE